MGNRCRSFFNGAAASNNIEHACDVSQLLFKPLHIVNYYLCDTMRPMTRSVRWRLILTHVSIPIAADRPPIRDVGGILRVGSTGVTVETVLWTFLKGATPEDIVTSSPRWSWPTCTQVVAYYLRHREEIDGYLALRERATARR